MEGVKVEVQVAVPAVVPAARVQVVNVPVTVVTAKVTEPVGVMTVPAVELSATVTVHVEPWLTTTGLVHVTAVVVVRRLTVTLAAELVLPP
jgi:hypothetical protein